MSVVQAAIQSKLTEHFSPVFLQLENESHKHNVPANSETHFKVTLVSENFEGLRQVARHQQIYKLLKEELDGPVHALALHTYTAEEWAEVEQAPDSPKCLGGSKAD